jgi:tripartite-type tricarboxylate transporter receptor subunit TctC
MQIRISKIILMVGLCAGLIGQAMLATAADNFPARPVSMVVPFPPGGACDLNARALQAGIEPVTHQTMMIINKGGAGGAIGMQYASLQKPDGYTLLTALASEPYLHEVDRLFDRKALYTPEDFIPIARLSADPLVIAVHNDAKWKTAQEFIADAKKRPGEIRVGSAGVYSVMHVAHELFIKTTDIKLNHIPYTGGGPTMSALLGRHVDCAAFGPSVIMQQIKAGKIRVLAVLGDKRLESMPEVPTAKELGYDAEFYIWAGVFAITGTPDSIVQYWRDAVDTAVQRPEFITAMKNIGTPIQYLRQPEFIKFLEKDGAQSRQIVRDIGRIQ